MGEIVSIIEKRVANDLARLSGKLDEISVRMESIVERAEQRLYFVENLIEAISDPEIGEKLAEQRQHLLAALNDAKLSFQSQLAHMKSLSVD